MSDLLHCMEGLQNETTLQRTTVNAIVMDGAAVVSMINPAQEHFEL